MSDLLTQLQQDLQDQYAIERELGRGGMATVFLARDLKHERQVAVKVLNPDLAAGLGEERFRREINIVMQLSHPHILPIYDSGAAAGSLYYVMPFVHGESLRQRLERDRQLSVDEAVGITVEAAAALDYAHRHGVIHRDIKPDNILLEDGHAIVADFGIARAISAAGDERLTQTGVTLGTPTYMSPEQAAAERNVDGRSDLYSLGCVLYEMLAGQPPFVGPTAQAIIARHSLDEVPSLTIVRGSIPDDIEDAVLQALAKVPADRFSTVAEFAAALTGDKSGDRRTTVRRGGRRRKQGRSRTRTAGLIAAVAVPILLVVTGGLWFWPSEGGGAEGGAQPRFDPKRVAVLYFDDNSRNAELAYLADGLTESLIERLDDVQSLDVVSSNGVEQFRGTTDLDRVVTELNAGTLVRGAVEPAGDSVRVTVRLVDGNSGADFQRGVFAQPMGDLLAARDSVAEQVATFLRQRLGEDVRLRRDQVGTSNAQAWSLLQQGDRVAREAAKLANAGSADSAAALFTSADSLLADAEQADEEWAAPIVARASLAQQRIAFETSPVRVVQLIESGIARANRALAVDPKNADALELRGSLRFYKMQRGLESDPRRAADLLRLAEEDLQGAVSIDPTHAAAWFGLSQVHYRKYDKTESNLAARRAYEADAYLANAREILWRLYATSYDMEQFVAADNHCREGQRRYPDDFLFVRCQLWLLTSNAHEANVDEGWRLAARLDSLAPAPSREIMRREAHMLVAAALGRRGMVDSARNVLDRARANHSVDPSGNLLGIEAAIRTMLGENDEAIQLLQQFLTSNPVHREGFVKNNSWWWRPLHSDPRFQALVGTRN